MKWNQLMKFFFIQKFIGCFSNSTKRNFHSLKCVNHTFIRMDFLKNRSAKLEFNSIRLTKCIFIEKFVVFFLFFVSNRHSIWMEKLKFISCDSNSFDTLSIAGQWVQRSSSYQCSNHKINNYQLPFWTQNPKKMPLFRRYKTNES